MKLPLAAPNQVLLFTGHMVDAPGRPQPRFPADKVPAATRAIQAALDDLNAGPADQAFSQAAAGGDLIFAETCVGRGVPVQLLLPLPEGAFLRSSLYPSHDGALWVQRYHALTPRLTQPPRSLPEPASADAPALTVYERCNQWLLDSALACGPDRLKLICLWDGASGDAEGGTAHMVEQVRQRAGRIIWIDTRKL